MEPPTISAGWLVLRPFALTDAPWVHEVSLDPAMRQFVELPSPYRFEDAEFFVREVAVAGWRAGRRAEFLAEEAATGARLGRVGLGLPGAGLAEVGYWVDPRARGRGVATQAVRAVCRWGFDRLGLRLIEWRAEVGNVASRGVAERAGFVVEATLRQRLRHRGTWVDAWVGSLLPEEIDPRCRAVVDQAAGEASGAVGRAS
ncbi:GNAT family protein [Micromonospora sp. NPDC047074]|uniref:GNAT family N-acetyltransferase n=1 Tax=Micromonospora sp. NPDC047074 TaxID=3154339 RepID=UPI0033FC4FDB